MYNRYNNIEKFIIDPNKLQMVNGSEVYISSEENYNIVVDLQGHTDEFEQLKPFIITVVQNVCELDNTAQKFDKLQSGSPHFPYVVSIGSVKIISQISMQRQPLLLVCREQAPVSLLPAS